MPSPFHAVARGLRLTNVGFLLVCWAAAAVLGLFWGIEKLFNSYRFSNASRWVFVSLVFAAIGTIVGGVVVGFVGRCFCLRVPAEFPGVRGRAWTAVVLEGSGWLSLFVGYGVAIAMSFRWLPDAQYVPMVGVLFSLILLLCGRILFLRSLRNLAEVVEDKPSVRRANSSLTLFVADWLFGVLGMGVLAGGDVIGMEELTHPLAYLIWIVTGMSGLAGMILYDRLLGGLARSVRSFADDLTADERDVESGTRSEPPDATDRNEP